MQNIKIYHRPLFSHHINRMSWCKLNIGLDVLTWTVHMKWYQLYGKQDMVL